MPHLTFSANLSEEIEPYLGGVQTPSMTYVPLLWQSSCILLISSTFPLCM